jgi:hypothetical protein
MTPFATSFAQYARLLRGTILIGVLGYGAFTQTASALDLTLPTSSWTPITYANNNDDPFDDQQTGDPESDIVGGFMVNGVRTGPPAAYTMFDPGGASLTDGTLAFRVRVGAQKQPALWARVMMIGIDANTDGKLDVFVIANNQGNLKEIDIYKAGTGANNSPNTT